MFKKGIEIPDNWQNILLCSKWRHYDKIDTIDVDHNTSPWLAYSNWHSEHKMLPSNICASRIECITPHYIFEHKDKEYILMQIYEDSSWYKLDNGYFYDGCSSCDGKTESRLRVYEYVNIYDLFIHGFTDSERHIIFNYNDITEDEIIAFEENELITKLYVV